MDQFPVSALVRTYPRIVRFLRYSLRKDFRLQGGACSACHDAIETQSLRSFLLSRTRRSHTPMSGVRGKKTPKGYVADHNRIELGKGVATFERAKRAVRNWKMFDMPWIDLCWPDTPVESGAGVAVLISHLGFWSLNACRIVYVIDERGSSEKYGFAYGTLPDHGERGEERFTVEFNSDQTVWYDLYAFSRPNMLARLAYSYTRLLQKRFARDSKAAMQKAVQS